MLAFPVYRENDGLYAKCFLENVSCYFNTL